MNYALYCLSCVSKINNHFPIHKGQGIALSLLHKKTAPGIPRTVLKRIYAQSCNAEDRNVSNCASEQIACTRTGML